MKLHRGFHLIELIVVLAVMATAVAVVVPRMGDGQSTYRLNLATKQITQDIESTRESARYESRPKSISFDPVVSTYLTWTGTPAGTGDTSGGSLVGDVVGAIIVPVYELVNPNLTISRIESKGTAARVAYSDTGEVIARQVMIGQAPYNATLLDVDFAGSNTLTFTGYGMPLDGGTLVIAVGRRGNLIKVDPASGSVGSSPLDIDTILAHRSAHETLIEGEPERDADSLLAVGETLSDTVEVVTGTVESTIEGVGGAVETVGGGLLGGLGGLLGGGR